MSNETSATNAQPGNSQPTPQNQRQELGALWKKEGRNQTYLTGYVTTADGKRVNVVVFSSKNKKNERQPDYRIYESIDNKGSLVTQDKQVNQPPKATTTAASGQNAPQSPKSQDPDEDLI